MFRWDCAEKATTIGKREADPEKKGDQSGPVSETLTPTKRGKSTIDMSKKGAGDPVGGAPSRGKKKFH